MHAQRLLKRNQRLMHIWLYALLLAALGARPTQATGPAVLLRDLDLWARHGWIQAMGQSIVIGSTLYFTAADAENGLELWKSDGTAAGTRLIKDISPGPTSGGIRILLERSGKVFFFRIDSIWSSDGTAEGTVQVASIPSGQTLFAVYGQSVNNLLYFLTIADDGNIIPSSPPKLMRSDGTPEGTIMLKEDITLNLALNNYILGHSDNTIFFASGTELWKSDGTPQGTERVYDIVTAAPDDKIYDGLMIGGKLFFTSTRMPFSSDGPFVTSLWQSDGTAAGTALIKQFSAPTSSGIIGNLIDIDGSLFFSTNTGSAEIWKSDGSSVGTTVVASFGPNSGLSDLTNRDGQLHFVHFEKLAGGAQLWATDGTATGTRLLKDFPEDVFPLQYLDHLISINGTLFFSVGTYTDRNLWKSNGTPEGTVLVRDFSAPNDGITGLENPIRLNGRLFFAGYDRVDHFAMLWSSDGTADGTWIVAVNEVKGPAQISQMTAVGATLFFTAQAENAGVELWKSDGTPQGTVLVKDIFPGPGSSNPSDLTAVGAKVFFQANDGGFGEELWVSDGTAAGTQIVRDGVPGAESLSPFGLTNVDGMLFFTSNQWRHSTELWKSDGTAQGTLLVKTLPTRGLTDLTAVNRTLFFLTGDALWKSDGTDQGTVSVKTVYTTINGAATRPYERPTYPRLHNHNGTLFFSASDTLGSGWMSPDYPNNLELWKSDGTPAGTTMVKDMVPDGGTNPVAFTSVGNTLFFVTSEARVGELWRSDGTAAGTFLVKGGLQPPNSGFNEILSLTGVNGALFFSAYDSAHGRQLWKSDGTPAGTVIVRELSPALDALQSQPIVQARAEGGVLFAAGTPNQGAELWQSDGTAAGTFLLQDFNPGPGSSNPSQMIAAGNVIYLTVYEPSSGRELWAIDRRVLGAMPQAHDMLLGTWPDVPISGALAGVAPDGVPLSYTLVSNGASGVAVITDPARGTFTYTPAQAVGGRDQFTFKVSDGTREATATVTVVFWTHAGALPLIQR